MRSPRHLALILAIIVPGLIQAADLYVDPAGDDLLNDCLSLGSPCATIQAAISKAVAPATIHVAAGTYVENVLISKDVVVDGAGAGLTVVDGLGLVGSVFAVDATSTVTLSNLTVTHGLADDGGGIHNMGNLVVLDSHIIDNDVNQFGEGGGIFCGDESNLTLTRVQVLDNEARAGAGLLFEGATLLIEDSEFRGNNGTFGGGLSIGRGNVGVIRRTLFEDNFASSRGSAFDNSADLILEDSIVRNNVVTGEGGTLYSDRELLINRTLIVNNQSTTDAGALKVESSETVVLNSTIVGNSAGDECGAICNFSELRVINSTIARNSATTVGGIQNGHVMTIRNSIVAENTALTAPDCAGNLISEGYNLIGDDSGCTLGGDLGTSLVNLAPGLGTLQDNGGLTETLGLFIDSPAIDAGDPVGCTDHLGAPLLEDQRGATRPLNGRCDIGAFEGHVCETETCDFFDNNCDGTVDDGFDLDGDGVTTCGDDCDDGNDRVYPGNTEVACDSLDNDCDADTPDILDGDNDGALCDVDCDDDDDGRFPGNPEIGCDEIDQDCDAGTPDILDGDNDGALCDADCDDDDSQAYPGNTEVGCDSLDNDCDAGTPDILDGDNDGALCDTDCDDGNDQVYPGNTEVACDSLDNDCDAGTPDAVDGDNDGALCDVDCDDGDDGRFPGNPEIGCDGIDQDCDAGTPDILDADNDGALCDADCDDDNAQVYPGNTEIGCDEIDQDCDAGTPDVLDGDNDGALCDVDCDDNDDSRYPGNPEIGCDGIDQDCDAGTPDVLDGDNDGALCDADCDDHDNGRFPGNPEIGCDGIDQDCDAGTADVLDGDNDGALCDVDCDDDDDGRFPGNPEIGCDGIDQDCDAGTPDTVDGDNDGASCDVDCDDGDNGRFPGNPEIGCDGIDQDCDAGTPDTVDGDSDGALCDVDCDDDNDQVYPGNTEVGCDSLDNDCDGLVDEGFDLDGDGFASCGGDCDDGNANRFPGNPEICDGVDNNCDGLADAVGEDDSDGDGVVDCLDNCVDDQNLDQLDGDGDDVGDVCDDCPDDDGNGLGVNAAGCSGLEPYVCAELDDLLSYWDDIQKAIDAGGLSDGEIGKLREAQRKLIEGVEKLHEGSLHEIFKKTKDAIAKIIESGSTTPDVREMAEEMRWFLDGLLALAELDPNFDANDYAKAQQKYANGITELVDNEDYKEAVHKFEESASELEKFLTVMDPCDLVGQTETVAIEMEADLLASQSSLVTLINSLDPEDCALDELNNADHDLSEALNKLAQGFADSNFDKFKDAVDKLKKTVEHLQKIDQDDPFCMDTKQRQSELTLIALGALNAWHDLAVAEFGEANGKVVEAKAEITLGGLEHQDSNGNDDPQNADYFMAMEHYKKAMDKLKDLF